MVAGPKEAPDLKMHITRGVQPHQASSLNGSSAQPRLNLAAAQSGKTGVGRAGVPKIAPVRKPRQNFKILP